MLFSNCARSLEYSSSSTLAGLSYHICGKLEVAFKASPSSQHQHCTDEAQKAETVLSAVRYIYIYIYTYTHTIFRKNDKIMKRKMGIFQRPFKNFTGTRKRFIEIPVGTCSRPSCIFCLVSITTVVVPLSAFLGLISLFVLSIFRASLCRVERLSFLV